MRLRSGVAHRGLDGISQKRLAIEWPDSSDASNWSNSSDVPWE